MKKAIFSIIALLLVCAAFGQKTDTRIHNIIEMSKEYNAQHNGIYDPNKIWPGQTLNFFFEDGTQYEITVLPGDTETDILREIIELEKEHGPVVAYPYPVEDTVPSLSPSQPINFSTPEPFPWWSSFPWGWLLFAIAVSALLIKLLQMRYTARRQDPITAGAPQVPGGVKDAMAHNRVLEIAQSRFPGAQINVRNIRRVWLSGLANVFYAGDKQKKLRLKDVSAYAGEAEINGREETIYFLQGCGNDVRQGNYMTGDLEFRPEVIINQDGSESPIPEAVEVMAEQITEEQPNLPAPVVTLGSETHQRKMKILEILSGETGNSELHKIIIEEAADGSFKAQIEYKYEPRKKTN